MADNNDNILLPGGENEAPSDRSAALERALNAIEHKMHLILQNIRDIVYMVDQKGFITFINEPVRRYGYTPEELIGTRITDLVSERDRGRATWHLCERRTGERRTRSYVLRLQLRTALTGTSDNHPVVSLTAEGIYNPAGDGSEFMGTVGVVHDLTVQEQRATQTTIPFERTDRAPIPEGAKDTPHVRIEIADPVHGGHVELVCSVLEMNSANQMLPICSSCKRIRNENGDWEDIEEYLGRRFSLEFTHSICSDCESELYDDFLRRHDDG